LLRRPGSDNTKVGEPRQCRVLEHRDASYDISEFDDLFDLYGDRPLLTLRENRAKKANGCHRQRSQAAD